MSYYLVRNELTKEFAIVESEIIQEIDELIDEYGVQDVYFSQLDDNQNWDMLVEEEVKKGYRYVVLEADTDDAWDFTMSGTLID